MYFFKVGTLLIIIVYFSISVFLLVNIILILLEAIVIADLLRGIPEEDGNINVIIPIKIGLNLVGLLIRIGIIMDFDRRKLSVEIIEVHFF